jgi:GTP-binding protein
MYLQGNLQAVFDALYEMGMIEPVLEMDWKDALGEIKENPEVLQEIMNVVSRHQQDPKELIKALKKDLPKIPYVFISSVAQQGLVELKDLIWKHLNADGLA